MKINAKSLFISKCILWIIAIVVLPFFYYHPTFKYITDKNSIEIKKTNSGDVIKFDAINKFNHKIHVQYTPHTKETYFLSINGKEIGRRCKNKINNNNFIYKDSHIFMFSSTLNSVFFSTLLVLQIFLFSTILVFLMTYSEDITEYYNDGLPYGFRIRNGYGTSQNSFLYSIIFRLWITPEQLINVNKFFGFDTKITF